MAKIIEQGVFRKRHKECGSLIEFSSSELKEDFIQDYLGDRSYFRFLVCPACLHEMRFSQYGKIEND